MSKASAACALLFAAGGPFEKKHLATLLKVTPEELSAVTTALRNSLQHTGLTLVETEDELELRTAPETADVVAKLRESELARDLGKASLETLAVIAYQKGPTRSQIDWVRGVNSSASIRTLLLRGLVEGREDARDKRRVRYALTTEGLAHLGLSRAEDLPRYAELSAESEAAARAAEESH